MADVIRSHVIQPQKAKGIRRFQSAAMLRVHILSTTATPEIGRQPTP
jgi:hypothetical protein